MSDALQPRMAISEAEAAEQLSVSSATLRRSRSAGTGPRYVRLGRRVVYRPEDLAAHLAANIKTPTSEGAASC